MHKTCKILIKWSFSGRTYIYTNSFLVDKKTVYKSIFCTKVQRAPKDTSV